MDVDTKLLEDGTLDYWTIRAKELGISREEYRDLTHTTRFGMACIPND